MRTLEMLLTTLRRFVFSGGSRSVSRSVGRSLSQSGRRFTCGGWRCSSCWSSYRPCWARWAAEPSRLPPAAAGYCRTFLQTICSVGRRRTQVSGAASPLSSTGGGGGKTHWRWAAWLAHWLAWCSTLWWVRTCATSAFLLSLFTAMAKSSHVQVLLWYSRQGRTRFRSFQSTLLFSPCRHRILNGETTFNEVDRMGRCHVVHWDYVDANCLARYQISYQFRFRSLSAKETPCNK